jgi:hypothetical protein
VENSDGFKLFREEILLQQFYLSIKVNIFFKLLLNFKMFFKREDYHVKLDAAKFYISFDDAY